MESSSKGFSRAACSPVDHYKLVAENQSLFRRVKMLLNAAVNTLKTFPCGLSALWSTALTSSRVIAAQLLPTNFANVGKVNCLQERCFGHSSCLSRPGQQHLFNSAHSAPRGTLWRARSLFSAEDGGVRPHYTLIHSWLLIGGPGR